MNPFLTQVEAFLNAQVLPQAKQKIAEGTEALRQLADYLDAQAAGLKFAAPHEQEKCKELLERCKAECPCPSSDPHAPKGFGLPGNPILTLLAQILQTVLAELITNPTPTVPPATT